MRNGWAEWEKLSGRYDLETTGETALGKRGWGDGHSRGVWGYITMKKALGDFASKGNGAWFI